MTNSVPVMNEASSEARNSTPLATSIVSPVRRSGVNATCCSRMAGSDRSDDCIGGMKPGCTEFTRMPWGPYLTAIALVNMRTAPLDAWYAG